LSEATRYAAFLRGINLGGRRVKNEELREAFERLGFEGVSCFRASGNVVFAAVAEGEGALRDRIEAGLGEELGYEVAVFPRGAEELRAVAARRPFDPAHLAASRGKPQVAFLPAPPPPAARERALALASDEDRLAIEGRELHWLPSGGISESELELSTLESLLGPWTMRTAGTVEQIAARHFAA